MWDRDEETAIQSSSGGTKISWGGESAQPKVARSRQRFDLVAADPEAESARLTTLGAVRVGDRDGTVELTDPDGHEFSVTA